VSPQRRGVLRKATIVTATLLLTTVALAAALREPAGEEAAAQEPASAQAPGGPAVRGADISFILQEEAVGATYTDRGRTAPVEQLLADRGANWVRLRVWTDPPEGYSDAASALTLAKRAKAAGMKVLLNLHYSDFWADPGKQPTPAMWEGQDLPTLAQTVHDYTRDLVADFARQGAPVDMIQIGNEVVNGMLWPTGEIYVGGQERWEEFTTLLSAGIDGARAGNPSGHDLRVMVHIDRGGNNADTRYFYDHVLAHGVAFDVIGLSYYPFWHGSMADLRANLHDTAAAYGKDIVVVETSYPWTLENGDDLENFINDSNVGDLPDNFPPTPGGQVAFFEALRRTLSGVPGGHGLGFFAWEPAWIPGVGWEPGAGTPNDNLTMFDFTGRGLPSLGAFRP
jgi:arabinogalactan endo-1,4-beta-galactosidase